VIHFGRYKDKTLAEVWKDGKNGQGWIRWRASVDRALTRRRTPKNGPLQLMVCAFLVLNAAYAG